MSTQAFPALRGHNRMFGLAVAALAVAALALAAVDISAESYKRPMLVMLLFIQFLTALRNWRLSVYLFVAYVLVEGFIINYYSGQRELNLLKDAQLAILFLLLCAGTIVRHLSPFPRMPWMYMFAGFAAVYTLSALNPALPSIMVGLIGVRVTLIFATCVAIGYWFFRSTTDTVKFLHYHALLSIPISLFGIVQYFAGPGLLLSLSPGFGRAIYYAVAPGLKLSELKFRAISTFASTGGFSQYLWVAVILTWAYFLIARSRKEKWIAAMALLLQTGAFLAAGGRAPVVFAVVSLGIGYAVMRRLTRGIFVAALATATLVASIVAMGGPVARRFAPILDMESTNERNNPIIVDEFVRAMQAPVEGVGAGQLTAAANRWSENRNVLGVENQLARIRYESGVLGLFLFVLAVGMMFFTAVRIALMLRDPVRRIVGGLVAGYFVTLILIMPIGLPLDVPPTNFYFWFLFGMLHALARDEDMQNTAMRAAQSPVTP